MKIFIAGAGGFVGGVLVKRLGGHELTLPSRDPGRFARAGGKGSFPLFTDALGKNWWLEPGQRRWPALSRFSRRPPTRCARRCRQRLFGLLPVPPMTREQYLMMASPNVPSGKFRGVKDLLGGKG